MTKNTKRLLKNKYIIQNITNTTNNNNNTTHCTQHTYSYITI